MKSIITALGGLALCATATGAQAHDFFLLPKGFAGGPGKVAIEATVGSSFPVPEIVVPTDRAERLAAFGPGKPHIHVAGAGDKALNLEVTGAEAGLLVAVAASKPRDVDYAEDRIPLILEEYRVAPEAVAAVEALPRPRTWQVISRRFAKTFVCVSGCKDRSAAEKLAGTHLEFVGSASSDRHYTLLADGKPLANYPVDLVDKDGKRSHLATDSAGSVHLGDDRRGAMMLFAARLQPPAGAGRFVLDLTSLTFSRP